MPERTPTLPPPASPAPDPSLGWAEFSARLASDSPLHRMLSPAERAVTMQVRLGLSNKEIAAVLRKSPATVKAQIASILRKLGVPTRCRLIAWLHAQTERT